MIHRDLNPESVMLGACREVLAEVWGLAKCLVKQCLEFATGFFKQHREQPLFS